MQDSCSIDLVKSISVLLVDDHPTLLWGLARLVESSPTKMEVVGTATSCAEALLQARETRPDVIVLDLHLSCDISLDIVPALISDAGSKVLLLTGERDQKTLDLAVAKGARGVLSKDASANTVLEAIRSVHEGEFWLDHRSVARLLSSLARPSPGDTHPAAQKLATLTAKERAVVDTIVNGSGEINKVIAGRLCMAEHTLRNHLSSIYQKIGVRNRLELYMYAVNHKADKVAALH